MCKNGCIEDISIRCIFKFNNVLLKCSSILEVHNSITKNAREMCFVLLESSSSAVCGSIKWEMHNLPPDVVELAGLV